MERLLEDGMGEEVILLVWYTSLALEESREAERLMLID